MGALWTGVTGLLTFGESMAVVGNNLANVNTTGYKKTDILFEELMSQQASASAGNSQVGKGVRVSETLINNTVGSFDPSNESTDMAITGSHGYFQVKNDKDDIYYTRDGTFRFDKDGNMVNSLGYSLQGWNVDRAAVRSASRSGTPLSEVPVTGTVTDINIKDLKIEGAATSTISVITNLDAQANTGTNDATDPYFSMFKNYEYTSGSTSSPVNNASYSTNINVYDQDGTSHELTVYYRKTSEESGKQYWEYLVSADPKNDGRTAAKDGDKAGVVMIGSLTFSDNGTLEDMTAYTLSSNATDATSLGSWSQATMNSSGYPQFSMSFKNASGASLSPVSMSMQMGIKSTNATWSAGMAKTASAVGQSSALLHGLDASTAKNSYYTTTNYASSSYTQTWSQDGYAEGELLSLSVNEDGVIEGSFTNGQTVELFVLAMADFINPAELRREGNNLFSATKESGKATIGRANSGVFDAIAGKSLETSNVDMATEMVNMIITQRGFQANSKVVTTADAMMQKALEIKR